MGQLLLVRHGQASFGAADYDVLSETGWAQGRALGEHLRLAGIRPTALVRGTMRRHRETLEAIAETADWSFDDVLIDAGWDEFDHVALVGSLPDLPAGDLDRRTFQQYFEKATAAWTAGTHEGAGETYAGFLERVSGAMAGAVALAGSGATVVVVTSGGPIAALAAGLVDPEGTADAETGQATRARLWSRFNTVVVNAAITRVVAGSTGARLLTFNEHPHLAGDLLTYR
ncbi:MAG: histidine phosphatase family protein [Nocardioides sp.]